MTKITAKIPGALAGAALIAMLAGCANYQSLPEPVESTQIPVSELDPGGDGGPALWKVADEDTTIYLFGTVHILPKEVEWYDTDISAALTSSETIVTEIKMDPASELALQQLAMTKGQLPPGTTLRSLLDEEQKASYEAAMGKLGLPVAAFDQLEPWMAGLSFGMLPLIQQGYSPDAGVEKVLLQEAGTIEQQALETAEFQIAIFDELPQDAQIAFMLESAEGVDEIKTMLDNMVSEWVEADAVALAELMNEGMTDPALAEALLYNRNANWAEWIDTRMDSPGTVFVAVGAGHLAGEKSVQDYLEERGIQSIRIQ